MIQPMIKSMRLAVGALFRVVAYLSHPPLIEREIYEVGIFFFFFKHIIMNMNHSTELIWTIHTSNYHGG